MSRALELARQALERAEIPVGALVVRDGEVLGEGRNLDTARHGAFGHAEIIALKRAIRRSGDWRLEGATMYVTLEPCPLCAGALVQSRVARLVYGAASPRRGCAGSLISLAELPGLDRPVEVFAGLRGDECRVLLEKFFKEKRGEVAEPG